MDHPDLPLIHLVQQPRRPSARPPLLLLLHGVGSNEHDLFSLAPYLDPRLLILSARAPNVIGPGSYAWFAVAFTPTGPLIDPEQAEASRQTIIQFIEAATAAYGADRDRVYLMGFSQGAIMSVSVALTRPDLAAGAVLMSGRVLPEIAPEIASPQRLAGLPILVVHGLGDTVLPIHHGRASRALLEKLPVALEYHEYPMGHEVSEDSLAAVVAWLSRQLDAPGRTRPEPAPNHKE